MKGRKRTPTPVLTLRGSWVAKTRKGEPVAPAGTPEPPEIVSADPVALAEWNLAVSQMSDMRTLSPVHRWLLAGFCITVSRLAKAQAVLDERGLTQPVEVKTIHRQNGDEEVIEKGEQKRPEVSIVSDCTAQIKAYMAELCITPASQSKATAKPAGKDGKPGKERFFA